MKTEDKIKSKVNVSIRKLSGVKVDAKVKSKAK